MNAYNILPGDKPNAVKFKFLRKRFFATMLGSKNYHPLQSGTKYNHPLQRET